MANRRDGEETRERILSVACEVFSEHGYNGSTNAEICRKSGVNGAAVNYHFRNKEALYVEAFKTALEKSLKSHPLVCGNATSPELRLKSMIRATISRISDPDNRSFGMLRKEMNEPTGLLEKTMCQFIEDEQALMRKLVGEVMGQSSLSPRKIDLCSMSVLAQCIHPAIHERRRIDKNEPVKEPFNLDEVTEHVFSFSMAAISTISKESCK